MKKTLLIASLLAIATVGTQAQVTQINANKDLDFVAQLGTNKAVFASAVDNHLYVSDGSASGTTLLSSTIEHEESGMSVNGKVLFRGTTAATGSELFITDGTAAGTTLLKDIYPGAGGSSIGSDMVILNGFVYFTASSPAYGREIWKTDGTAAGTTLLKDIIPGPTGSNTADGFNLFSNGSYLLFSAGTLSQGYELWKSNGTESGTVLLRDITSGASSSNAQAFFQLGNIVLFQAETPANGQELWKTDGTEAGTVLVKDIYSGPVNSTSMLGSFFYEFNGRAYFNAKDGVAGEELWSTDGTTANTNRVKDIQTGPNSSFNLLFNAIKVGNKFIFASTNLSGTRYQLWQSDGTETGTTMLKDFTSGGELPIIFPAYEINGNSYSQPLFGGNKFFFAAKTAAEGTELWISDGTTGGTTLVKNINAGSADGLEDLTYQYTSNAIYFAANDGVHGNELWKSDGTENGTVLVADMNVGTGSSDPTLWPIFNGKLTLSANDGNNTASDLFVLNGNVSPLPVKLTDISVNPVGTDARLQWVTMQELNTREFIIQRSEDGLVFKTIGTVQAAGQSDNRRTYSFVDAGIVNSGKSTVYYRLQVMDRDGKSELSKIVSLKITGTPVSISLLNNPVQSSIHLAVNGITGTSSLRITDMTGKMVYTTSITNDGLVTLPAANLTRGLYLISIIGNDQTIETIRFIKQ